MTGAAETNIPRRGFVLVADDAVEMRVLIDDVLTAEGYEVKAVPTGRHALGVLEKRTPDLVITDLLMPGMDGFALRAEMLRRPDLAEVPVIVLSSFWQRPSETLEAVEVIGKPLDLDRLLDAVRRATAPEAANEPHEHATTTPASRATLGTTGGGSRERRRDAGRVEQEA
jgi:CheY-like chemotaxis protein